MFSVNTHELKKSGSQLFDCSNELKTMAIRLGTVSGSLFMGKRQQRMVLSGIRAAASSVDTLASGTQSLCDALAACADEYENAEEGAIDSLQGVAANLKPEASASEKTSDADGKTDLWDFLKGGVSKSDAVIKGRQGGFGEFLGLPIGGAVAGELIGGSASLKPEFGASITKGNLFAGIKGDVEGHVAQGSISGDYGLSHTNARGKVLTGAVSGELGASLFRNGVLDPSLKAKASVKASVLSGNANMRIGTEDFNRHIGVSGDVLTAKAEASAQFGKDGIGAKVEAGAYAVSGAVTGGISILGIKIDATLEGHAGGAGVKAGFGATDGKLSAEVGAGLLAGAGVGITIDFSGVPKALENTVNWWNNLWK